MVGFDARFRLLTPPGSGGVAVVEVTGPDREVALGAILDDRGGGALRLVGVVAKDGSIVDRALRVERPGGEALELHLHGSPAVLSAVAEAVGGFAVGEPAGAAERLMADAVHPNQLALALEQQRCGGFAALRSELGSLSGESRDAALELARSRNRVAQALVEPCSCVLVGRQNAGKSTLLNRLAFRERALTGASPGLTRDPVREAVVLSGYPYRLIDTAGLGDAVDELDAWAQSRSRQALDEGLVVLVADGSVPLGPVEAELGPRAAFWVRTKSDLVPAPWIAPAGVPCVPVSCLEPGHAATVRAAVGEALRELRGLPPAPVAGVGGPVALDAAERDEFERIARGFRA